jgi:hypothetical protein
MKAWFYMTENYRVLSWTEQCIKNLLSASVHQEVCVLISVSFSVATEYICVCVQEFRREDK